MSTKPNSKPAFEGATKYSEPAHEEHSVVSFPCGNPVLQTSKKLSPPTNTVDPFAHVTKILPAQQFMPLLTENIQMCQQQQQQQQQGTLLDISDEERASILDRQIKAQNAQRTPA